MTKRLLLLAVLGVQLFGAAAGAQQPVSSGSAGTAAAANPHGLTPAEAQRAIEVLQDPRQRAALIATLQAIAKSSPAAAAQAAKPAPAEKPGTAAMPAPVATLAPHSLASELLSRASVWTGRLAGDAIQTAQALTDFPLLWGWAQRVVAEPQRRMAVINALWQLGLVVVCSLLLQWVARRVLSRPMAGLAAYAPDLAVGGTASPDADLQPTPAETWHLLRRLPFALARLAIDLLPLGVFWGAGALLAGLVPTELTRLAALVVISAYATGRAVMSIGRMLVSPATGRLRLLHVSDDQAAYVIRWLQRITVVAVCGNALASLALLFGLNEGAYDTLVRLIGLLVAALLAIWVLRSHRAVARRLRAAPGAGGGVARWRQWLASAWHYLALIAIIAAWMLWAAGVRNGLGGLRVLIGTIAILVGARLAAIVGLGLVDRGARLGPELARRSPGVAARAARYHAVARVAVTAVVAIATALALLQAWGANAVAWFEPGRIGARLASAAATVALAALAAIVVWEAANAALEQRLARLSAAGSAAHSARLRTLLPMLRAALLATVVTVVGLTALSEVGVNIAPLLAGAGIVGIAVGFGAQKLVQDVITGLFVLFENAIQIGDFVSVAGLSGNVERLSVRNIWLRGSDGAVHIVPFSAVTSITNTNRGLGNAGVSVTLPFAEDSDRVAAILTEIAAGMRADNAFAPLMLGDLQLWVDSVKAGGVTLAGLIACTDAGRWAVQHEFNRRLQKRFQELGIELGSG